MIVVDTSVVVDALVGGDDAPADVLAGERMMAPHLIDHEVLSALRGLVRGGHLGIHRAEDALDDYGSLAITRWQAAADLRRRAFSLRDTVTAYDAAFVVLAEALECPLLTRDRRLAKAVDGLVDVRVV